MINTLNVLLSNHSVSFCHYDINESESEKWIDAESLKKVLEYSVENKIAVNVVFPLSPVPKELEEILANENYHSTSPYKIGGYSDMKVIELSEIKNTDFNDGKSDVLVIMFKKNQFPMLFDNILKLSEKFKRLSFVITDVIEWTKQDIDNYEKELNKNFDLLVEIYKNVKGTLPEINFITDRWFLGKENSCNAGITHYTVGPDGNAYLCPAFYVSNNENIGRIGNIKYINEQLLQYDHGPICKSCDAYHCNRCIYLNKNMTNEYNIPSFQQCMISHIEREVSRKLLKELKKYNPLFNQIKSIPVIDYVDPLEKKILRISSIKE